MKNYINRPSLTCLMMFLFLFPSILLSSQIQFSRDSYILKEGMRPIFDLEVTIINRITGKNLYEGVFKRNQVGEIVSIDNGSYLLTINHQSLLRSRSKSGGNQYLINLDDDFIKIELGKKIDLSSPKISLQRRSFSYGISNFNIQKLFPSSELEISKKESVSQHNLIKSDNNKKQLKNKEPVNNLENKLLKQPASQALNSYTQKLADDLNANLITFNEAIQSLKDLKSSKVISEKEFAMSKDQFIEIYLNN